MDVLLLADDLFAATDCAAATGRPSLDNAPDLRSGTVLVQALVELLIPFVPKFGGLILTGAMLQTGDRDTALPLQSGMPL